MIDNGVISSAGLGARVAMTDPLGNYQACREAPEMGVHARLDRGQSTSLNEHRG